MIYFKKCCSAKNPIKEVPTSSWCINLYCLPGRIDLVRSDQTYESIEWKLPPRHKNITKMLPSSSYPFTLDITTSIPNSTPIMDCTWWLHRVTSLWCHESRQSRYPSKSKRWTPSHSNWMYEHQFDLIWHPSSPHQNHFKIVDCSVPTPDKIGIILYAP